jgi:predicted patatin/cPLA2 family phospholipase
MTIQHLVIGGGGPFGFTAFGVLKYLHDVNFWNIKNIKTIYATSIGTIIAAFLLLGYDYNYIYDYFIKRPWEKIFKNININNIFNIYTDKGAIEIYPLYVETLTMVLEAKNLSHKVTLKEFYEYSGVELNIIATELNFFKCEVISHKTYPDLDLIRALTISGSLPVIFTPNFLDNKCFVDGFIFSNYPLNICLNETKCEKNEILGVRKKCKYEYPLITNGSSFMEYMHIMFGKLLDTIGDHNKVETIPYDIICDVDILNDYVEWFNLFSVMEKRKKLTDAGSDIATEFYTSLILTSESTESSEQHIKNEVAEDSIELITSLEEGEKGEKGEK